MEPPFCPTSLLCMQVGMFQVLLLQRTPQRAYSLLQPLEPFTPFRDPSMGSSLFDLTVYHCIAVSSLQPLMCIYSPHSIFISRSACSAMLEGARLRQSTEFGDASAGSQQSKGGWVLGLAPAHLRLQPCRIRALRAGRERRPELDCAW